MDYKRLKKFTDDIITYLLSHMEAQEFADYLERQGYTDEELSEFGLGSE